MNEKHIDILEFIIELSFRLYTQLQRYFKYLRVYFSLFYS